MGSLSAKAQSLPGAITTGMKLMYSDHRLYILKDIMPESRQVIGILKVGRKKLFIYDIHGVQHELEPLCVLDFYVHESRQRQGCGRKLFDFMLQREDVIPRHLAIDRPSHKFSAFLEKHYLLKDVIPQMNNFVVFQGFFRDRTDYPRGRRHRSAFNSSSFGGNNRTNRDPQRQNTVVPDRRTSSNLPRLPSAQTRRVSASSRLQPHVQPPPQLVPEYSPNFNLTNNLKSMSLIDDSQARGLGVDRRGDASDFNHQTHREDKPASSPTRRGVAKQDLHNLNGHQEYLTRDGHLKTGPSITNRHDAQSANHFGSFGNRSTGPIAQQDDSNWTMYSVGKANNYSYQVGLNRNYKHTRLW